MQPIPRNRSLVVIQPNRRRLSLAELDPLKDLADAKLFTPGEEPESFKDFVNDMIHRCADALRIPIEILINHRGGSR